MSTKSKEESNYSVNEVPGRLEKNMYDLCIIKGDMNIAKAFCESCNKLQCDDCIDVHYKYPGLAEHILIPLSAVSKKITEFSIKDLCTCKKHKKAVEFFCKDDEKVICSTCFIADHRSCKHVVEITAIASDADVKLREVRGNLQDLGKEVDGVIYEIEGLKEAMTRQVENLPNVISEKRAHLNSCIRNTKNNLVVETNTVKSKYLLKFKEKGNLCNFILDECKECIEILTNIPKSDEKLKFIAKKKIEKRCKFIKDACKELSDIDKVEVFFEMNESFQLLDKTGGNIGILNVTQMKTNQENKDFRSVKLQMIRSIDLRKEDGDSEIQFISGIDFFTDGRLVMVDNRNKKIKIYDENLEVLNTPLELDYHPQDVVVTSNDEIAVTACVKRKIDIFRVSSSNEISFIRTINSKYQIQGIAVGEFDCFLVGHYEDDIPLSLISRTGEENNLSIEWIPAQYAKCEIAFAYIQRCNTVILGPKFENAIHIYDTELKTKVIVRNENIRNSIRMAQGPLNTVFICYRVENSSILQVSSTGHILSDCKLGIDNAIAIGISKDYKRMLISTSKSNTERKLHLVEIQM